MDPAIVSDRLAVLPQYLLPKGALTNFAGRVACPRRQAAPRR
jgi:phosphatidylserine decarboxylase